MSKGLRSSNPAPARRRRVPAVAVVVSRYNGSITDRLLDGALAAYRTRGGDAGDVQVVHAPGSYELPALAHAAAKTGRFKGVLALGCLIKGETSHDRYIAEAVAHGLVEVTIDTGVPCAFGVVTTDTADQAAARAGGTHGNKGEDSMHALLDTIEQIEALRSPGTGGVRVIAKSTAPKFGRTLPDKARVAVPGASRSKAGRAR